jgi:hypothetical protein
MSQQCPEAVVSTQYPDTVERAELSDDELFERRSEKIRSARARVHYLAHLIVLCKGNTIQAKAFFTFTQQKPATISEVRKALDMTWFHEKALAIQQGKRPR